MIFGSFIQFKQFTGYFYIAGNLFSFSISFPYDHISHYKSIEKFTSGATMHKFRYFYSVPK